MTIDDEGGANRSGTTARRPRWGRRHAVAGVVGLAALLGTGAYVLTTQIMDRNDSTVTRDTGALAPLATPGPATTSVPSFAPATRSTRSAAARSLAPSPSKSMTVDEQIAAARAAAAKDGHPVQRALVPKNGLTAQQAPVSERTEKTKTGMLRVVSAKFDLSGQRELLWAADKGKIVGHARCTQNFHFSNNTRGAVRPTMLMCWETSARKSVATIVVDQSGKPSVVASIAALEREWKKLG